MTRKPSILHRFRAPHLALALAVLIAGALDFGHQHADAQLENCYICQFSSDLGPVAAEPAAPSVVWSQQTSPILKAVAPRSFRAASYNPRGPPLLS